MKYRKEVIQTSHDSIFAGNLGTGITHARKQSQFYWSGVFINVKQCVRSCHICQKMGERVWCTQLRLSPRFLINIVGELRVQSGRGHRFILTMVDLCTRWVEALPLKYLTMEDVTDALISIFYRMEFPDVTLSENVSYSRTTRFFYWHAFECTDFQFSLSPIIEAVIANFHGSFKHMLAKVTAMFPKDWDRYLLSILFVYREVPHKATGFVFYQTIILQSTHI